MARDLDFLHLFAGDDAPGIAMQRMGRRAAALDVGNDPTEDIFTMAGMMWTGILAARLAPGGACHAGPECKSFVWITRHTSGRCKHIMGDDTKAAVRRGNFATLLLSWLFTFLSTRGVFWMIEQPSSSVLHRMPAIQTLFAITQPYKLCTWIGAFSKTHNAPKCVHLWTTVPVPLAVFF